MQIDNWFLHEFKITKLGMKNDNVWTFIFKRFMKQIHKYILKTLV
jgi:hypothetical protein